MAWPFYQLDLTNYKFLISTEIQVLLFCVLVILQGAFAEKWAGGRGQMGRGRGGQTKSEFWAGVPEKKKSREKWGGGREEKKWAGVGRLNPRVWTPPLHQTIT